MTSRERKGLEIAARYRLTQRSNTWRVPSQSGKSPYTVLYPNPTSCTCADFELNRRKCKHIFAVEYTSERERRGDDQADIQESAQKLKQSEPKKPRPTYKQNWSKYNQAQTNEKFHFQKLLFELCRGIPDFERPEGRPGRPRLPLRDMVFCAALKIYTRFSSRRFLSDVMEAKDKGYITAAPHFNSVLNYLGTEAMTPILHQLIADSSLPLAALESETAFSVDSSGFSTSKSVSWFNVRYGHEQDNHDWVKLHLSCSVKTHIVASATVTNRLAHDSPQFPRLIASTARNFTLKEVSADKAYSGKTNLAVVVQHKATPYIPFKTSATGAGGGLWQRLFHYYSFRRDEFLAFYHKRSNVESTFNMVKAKFDPYLRSKTEGAQVNEALFKVLCHNLCVLVQSMYELEIKPTLFYGTAQPPVGEDFKVEMEVEEDERNLLLPFMWK